MALSIGVGAILTSVLVDQTGVRAALVTVGLLCPLLAVVSWKRLRGMDRSIGVRDVDIDMLHGVPMLSVLPLPAIEQLARGVEPVDVPAGQAVFRQGDVGDRYFVIESGVAEVIGDGRLVASLGPAVAARSVPSRSTDEARGRPARRVARAAGARHDAHGREGRRASGAWWG